MLDMAIIFPANPEWDIIKMQSKPIIFPVERMKEPLSAVFTCSKA
jgi:hypothetical protein